MELIVISPDAHFADVPQAARRALTDWIKSQAFEQMPSLKAAPPAKNRSTAVGLLDSLSNRRVQARHACRLGADVFSQGSTVPNRCVLATSAPAAATWRRRSRFLRVLLPRSSCALLP